MIYDIWCNKNIASKHILKRILRKLYIKISNKTWRLSYAENNRRE